MILSVSRRTDIPAFFSEWFYNRIREGSVLVRNPMNIHQVSKINLSPDVVDCIVFWSKNPTPMLNKLSLLDPYMYYFQYTVTGYGKDVEPNIPDKKEVLIPTFQMLAKRLGRERVIWRYDPILFNARYTPEYHLKAFEQIADALHGCTEKCVFSFVDRYVKNRKAFDALGTYDLPEDELTGFAGKLAEIARAHDMVPATCAEKIDLSALGIEHNRCIDGELIGRLLGAELNAGKDKGQRQECGCVASREIGLFDTCLHGCVYCYANDTPERVKKAIAAYDPKSPLLCSALSPEDKIAEPVMKKLADGQMKLPL